MMYAMASKWFATARKILRREHGYTLIELAATTATIGLLVALAVPSYNSARQTAAKDEARGFGQEWRSLEWSCYLQQNAVTGTGANGASAGCFNDTNVGFSEAGTNWNFGSSTAPGNANNYTISPTTGVLSGTVQVIRCSPARAGTNVAGMAYQTWLTITGTSITNPFTGLVVGPGAMYDVFSTSATCP